MTLIRRILSSLPFPYGPYFFKLDKDDKDENLSFWYVNMFPWDTDGCDTTSFLFGN